METEDQEINTGSLFFSGFTNRCVLIMTRFFRLPPRIPSFTDPNKEDIDQEKTIEQSMMQVQHLDITIQKSQNEIQSMYKQASAIKTKNPVRYKMMLTEANNKLTILKKTINLRNTLNNHVNTLQQTKLQRETTQQIKKIVKMQTSMTNKLDVDEVAEIFDEADDANAKVSELNQIFEQQSSGVATTTELEVEIEEFLGLENTGSQQQTAYPVPPKLSPGVSTEFETDPESPSSSSLVVRLQPVNEKRLKEKNKKKQEQDLLNELASLNLQM